MQVQNLRDVLQEKISASDPFLQLEIEANQIMMQSALEFLKEAVAQPHRHLSHSTVAGLTGDIMYFMLLNEIAQAQSSRTTVALSNIQSGQGSEGTMAPTHYQWYNDN